MTTAMDDIRARVERAVRAMSDELAAMPDPNMEGRPAVRAQQAEARRVLSAQRDDLHVTHASMAKFSTRIEGARDTRAVVLDKIADCERRAAASTTDAERRAWLEGAAYLRGESGFYEMPGAIIALCRELRIDRLPTLPTCDEMLAQAEADLAPHLERLLGALDAWERRTVTADMAADLPAMQAHINATVR